MYLSEPSFLIYGPQPVFGVSDKMRLKPNSSATETSVILKNLLVARLDMVLSKANNKGADQTAGMRRLVCVFVVHNHRRQVFSR